MNTSTDTDRQSIEAHQLAALRRLIDALVPHNAFYVDTLRKAHLDGDIASLDQFTSRMPLTSKQQLVDNQLAHPPYGTNLTYPLDRYTRLCQTSGTTGVPMRWLDTTEDWQAMLDNWSHVFAAAGAGASDRAFFAFSFGPFLGFWTAFEAATQRGLMCIPGGGMTSAARLRTMLDNEVTVLLCTPTYALRLAEVAAEEGIDLSRTKVRRIIVAGEPGGSIPALRRRIEQHWPAARVFDHHGMTEVGPVSFENPNHPGMLHVIESAYLAEVIDPQTLQPVPPGEVGELVLTTLNRPGSPLLRYRTGDLVRISTRSVAELGRADLALDGGILGRADDMVLVRGVNLFPSAVDQIVRADEHVAEYRVDIEANGSMNQVTITVEPTGHCPDPEAMRTRLTKSLHDALTLRIPVTLTAPGSLPRFEFKSHRWHRR